MSRRWLLLLAIAACAHAHRVGTPEAGGEERQPAEHGKQGERGEHAARAPRLRPAPGRPPIAATPDAMLAPGGAEKIQGALASRGLLHGPKSGSIDEATSAALRKFQAEQGLAATGAPDHETLSRLGLDPKQVFRTNPGGDKAREGELEKQGK